jgi:hypothetical protein
MFMEPGWQGVVDLDGEAAAAAGIVHLQQLGLGETHVQKTGRFIV